MYACLVAQQTYVEIMHVLCFFGWRSLEVLVNDVFSYTRMSPCEFQSNSIELIRENEAECIAKHIGQIAVEEEEVEPEREKPRQ